MPVSLSFVCLPLLVVFLTQEAPLSPRLNRPAGRGFQLELQVNVPPATAFDLWKSQRGVEKFFAPRANIEPRVDGTYEIIFQPLIDPLGESAGTGGARILAIEEGRFLAFEWIPFVAHPNLGPALPPYMPAGERNRRPLPTWIELEFAPVEDDATRTVVRLSHFGFREGEIWDRALGYFRDRAWPLVMGRFRDYSNEGKEVDWHDGRLVTPEMLKKLIGQSSLQN